MRLTSTGCRDLWYLSSQVPIVLLYQLPPPPGPVIGSLLYIEYWCSYCIAKLTNLLCSICIPFVRLTSIILADDARYYAMTFLMNKLCAVEINFLS